MKFREGICLALWAGLFLFQVCSAIKKFNGNIAFSRVMDNGNVEIFTMSPDGKNLKQLTFNENLNGPIVNAHPSYSPDGKHVAYTSTRNGDANIFIMNADGSNSYQVVKKLLYSEVPSFSPDGKRIAFSGNKNGTFEIFTINIDGTGLKQLTFNNATNDGPKYTPDGKHIVFSSDVNGTGNPRNRDLYTMDAETGKNLRRITFGMDNRFARSISPNGKRIVFSSTENNIGNLYFVNIDGTGLKRITNSSGNGSGYSPIPGWPVFNGAVTPAWSPDGKYIVYADNSRGNYRIYKIKLDKSANRLQKIELTNRHNDLSIGWQPLMKIKS